MLNTQLTMKNQIKNIRYTITDANHPEINYKSEELCRREFVEKFARRC